VNLIPVITDQIGVVKLDNPQIVWVKPEVEAEVKRKVTK
jgi:hypothetical protein